MFGKIFDTMFTGSMVGAGPYVYSVMAFVIANTRDSFVELNPVVLATVIGAAPGSDPATAVDEIRHAIKFLCSPDPNSRTEDHQGARLVHQGGFLYFVVSFEKYRNMRDAQDRTDYMRNYMRKRRSGEETQDESSTSKDVNKDVYSKPPLAQAETEPETEPETEKGRAFALSPLDSPPPAPPPVISFTLNDKTEYPLTADDVAEYADTFPGVNVLAELKKIRLWCKDHPSDRKTKRGARAFVSRWLDRAQNQATRSRPQGGQQYRPDEEAPLRTKPFNTRKGNK
jgi:hypothetical protein